MRPETRRRGDPETGARSERLMVTRFADLDPRYGPATVPIAAMRNPGGAEEDL